MLIQEIVNYFKTKKDHYVISDGFIKAGYQQKDGGYINKAKKIGLEIDCKKAEPNQKWHFINSYALEKQGSDVYKHLLVCPELLLWIAEACGVDDNIVRKAEKKAREIINTGRMENKEGQSRNKAGIIIRKMIIWNMIEEKLLMDNYLKKII